MKNGITLHSLIEYIGEDIWYFPYFSFEDNENQFAYVKSNGKSISS